MSKNPKHDPAAASVAALDDALTLAQQAEQTYADAVENAEDVRARSRTDYSITEEDILRADARVVLWQERRQGTAAAVATARRLLVNTDTSLATAVVESGLFEAVLPKVPLTITTVRPSKAPDVIPAAVLVQTRGSVVDDIVGTIGGNVELFWFATPMHRSVEAEHVAREAQVHRINLTTHGQGSSETDDVVTQRVSLDVSHARAVVPVVRAMDFTGSGAHWVHQFGQGLAQTARDAMQSHGSPKLGVRIGSGFAGAQAATVKTWSHADFSSQSYSADGTCRTALTVTLKSYPGHSCYLGGAEMQAQILRTVEGLRDDCAPALGRVVDVKVLHVGLIDGAGMVARAVEAEVVFTSRLPEGHAVPAAGKVLPSPAVPAQRAPKDIREHLDGRGLDTRAHPGSRL